MAQRQQKQQHWNGGRHKLRTSFSAALLASIVSIDGFLTIRGEGSLFSTAVPKGKTVLSNIRTPSKFPISRRSTHRLPAVDNTAWATFRGDGILKPNVRSRTEKGRGNGCPKAYSEVQQPRENWRTPSTTTVAAMKGEVTTEGKGGEGKEQSYPRSSRKRRPPTLPQGEFRPKQSLGQNYLSDQNYVLKICNHFGDTSERGKRVVELGPGTGALTQVLHERFPDMLAVDIDQRAIELLEQSIPSLSVVMSDVLQVDYTKLAELRGGALSVIGNLPYHITSQILFTLCDHYLSVRRAVVTMQLEVAQRVVAKPGTKQYGILSVVFQLYARPRLLFHIPPTVFYPQPSVTSALISLDFTGVGPGVDQSCLKRVLSLAFQQRRKMLRQSLKPLLQGGKTLPEEFATKRPEQLQPREFVTLTKTLYGESSELPQGVNTWRGMRATGGGGGDKDKDNEMAR